MNLTYEIQTLTPIFSYGADQNKPEIRAASIRGQLRWWMELLGYSSSIPSIFGTTAGDKNGSSKVIVRVFDIQGSHSDAKKNAHKKWQPERCYPSGTRFKLSVTGRLGGLDNGSQDILQNTIQGWVLIGSLGSRSTRGGGSLQDANNSLSQSQWIDRSATLLKHSKAHLLLGQTEFSDETKCREVICDTLSAKRFDPNEAPLGYAKGKQRKTSPLRMRVVRFADADPAKPYRIAALWTEPSLEPLKRAIQKLQQGDGRGGPPKPIGDELANAIVVK